MQNSKVATKVSSEKIVKGKSVGEKLLFSRYNRHETRNNFLNVLFSRQERESKEAKNGCSSNSCDSHYSYQYIEECWEKHHKNLLIDIEIDFQEQVLRQRINLFEKKVFPTAFLTIILMFLSNFLSIVPNPVIFLFSVMTFSVWL